MYHSEEIKCQDIKVGDLLILKDNMIVPADCVLIKAPSNYGECQVQTGQLDGERSLKPKYALKQTQDLIDHLLSSGEESISVFCPAPDQSLFYFEGAIQLPNPKDKTAMLQSYGMTLENFLPRGATM